MAMSELREFDRNVVASEFLSNVAVRRTRLIVEGLKAGLGSDSRGCVRPFVLETKSRPSRDMRPVDGQPIQS